MELLRPLCSDVTFPTQSVAFTGTAGVTTGWPFGPQGVYLISDSDCYVAVGVDVTATATNGFLLPAGIPITVYAPQTADTGKWRVSAIQLSAAGTIYATPVNMR
jgi:hypothetical protein